MEESAHDIINLITTYTTELEKLDQLSATYLMTCIGAIGVIFGIIAKLAYGNKDKSNIKINKIISALYVSIPAIL